MGALTGMLEELDQESKTTRRVLERVPGDGCVEAAQKSMASGSWRCTSQELPGDHCRFSRRIAVPGIEFHQPAAAAHPSCFPRWTERGQGEASPRGSR